MGQPEHLKPFDEEFFLINELSSASGNKETTVEDNGLKTDSVYAMTSCYNKIHFLRSHGRMHGHAHAVGISTTQHGNTRSGNATGEYGTRFGKHSVGLSRYCTAELLVSISTTARNFLNPKRNLIGRYNIAPV